MRLSFNKCAFISSKLQDVLDTSSVRIGDKPHRGLLSSPVVPEADALVVAFSRDAKGVSFVWCRIAKYFYECQNDVKQAYFKVHSWP